MSDPEYTYNFIDGTWEYRHAGQLTPISDLSLDMMAIGIKSHRESAERCFSHGVEHGIGAGELLIAAKKRFKHGEWLPWLKENCEVAERTAQAYMRLARLPAQKRKAIADLPLTDALSAIRSREQKLADAEAREAHPRTKFDRIAYTTGGVTYHDEEIFSAPPGPPPPPPPPPPTLDQYVDEAIRQLDQLLYELTDTFNIETLRSAIRERLSGDIVFDQGECFAKLSHPAATLAKVIFDVCGAGKACAVAAAIKTMAANPEASAERRKTEYVAAEIAQ
jgi:Protein of unknown function (DUF3102)